jgi:ADP-heptose:LPS heptosyltransferase
LVKGRKLISQALIVCFGPLGRLLNAFSAVERLKETGFAGHLVLLTDPSMVGLAAKTPWFDDIISADLQASDLNLAQLAKAIKKNRYEVIIDLERSDRTRDLFAAFGLFAPKFAGSAPRAKWQLSESQEHEIDGDYRLLDLLQVPVTGSDLSGGPNLDWLLRLTGKSPSSEPGYFGLDGPFVLLNLVKPDVENGWPVQAFAALSEQLLSQSVQVAITGSMHARDMARPLIRSFPEIRDLCARADPFQLVSLGARAKGVVGMADGILHLCAAGAGRCISLHGSDRDARLHGIRSPNAMTLIAEPLESLQPADVIRAMKMFGAL